MTYSPTSEPAVAFSRAHPSGSAMYDERITEFDGKGTFGTPNWAERV